MDGRACQFNVVMHHDVVMEHRHPGRADQLARVIESGSPEYDIIGLPFSWRAAGINQRGVLTVDGCRHPIWVGCVIVAIKNLDFIYFHQKYTAVASILIFACGRKRSCPFYVKLTVSEFLFSADVTCFIDYLHVTIFDLPAGRLFFSVGPVGEVLAIEKDDGVRGWGYRFARRAWIYDRGLRPVRIVYFPLEDFLFDGLPVQIDSS